MPFGGAEAMAETLPHTREALLRSHGLVRRMLQLQLAWVSARPGAA